MIIVKNFFCHCRNIRPVERYRRSSASSIMVASAPIHTSLPSFLGLLKTKDCLVKAYRQILVFDCLVFNTVSNKISVRSWRPVHLSILSSFLLLFMAASAPIHTFFFSPSFHGGQCTYPYFLLFSFFSWRPVHLSILSSFLLLLMAASAPIRTFFFSPSFLGSLKTKGF